MIKRTLLCCIFTVFLFSVTLAQDKMNATLLWELGRVSPEVVTPSGEVVFAVKRYHIQENTSERNLFAVPLNGGESKQLTMISGNAGGVQVMPDGKIGYSVDGQWWIMNTDGSDAKQFTHTDEPMDNIRISPDGNYILFSRKVKIKKILGKDFYPDLAKSNVQIYDNLMYRHWNKWFDGNCSHVFYATLNSTGTVGVPVDIMQGEPYNCPQQPMGGPEDFIWGPGGYSIIYVCKKEYGKAYTLSTNTDIYQYDLNTGNTADLTEGMMGYDTQPSLSPDGKRLAWTSMKTDGYESDKNDLMVMDIDHKYKLNLTSAWDGTVSNFRWGADGSSIYFTAPVKGTIQLFEVKVPGNLMVRSRPVISQMTDGMFDIDGIAGQHGDTLVLSRQDMNHATELFTLVIKDNLKQLTFVNKDIYDHIKTGKVESILVATTDHKREQVWVVYPPDFDPEKKYPALLYCQGGPQAEVSQFYSFRWNLQLMAAHGYIVVAPNRRGLPGFGVKWNEEISKDWGGQPMRDYLSAIDSVSKLPFVDKKRLGCVGASYGGYSVYMLAGIHHNRFKTFIAHDGLFDTKSWYGTTDEMWFANWEFGGPYWDKNNKAARLAYTRYNPSNYVTNWNTPILIIQGGTDYRVPVEQGLEAFKAAQLRGIKSKILYFPEEDHWVLKPQDALVWQHEFFKWLEETL